MFRTRILLWTALAAILFCFSGTANAQKIAWAKSYSAALQEAKKTNRPVMIDFYTDWCGWCKRLDKDVYTNEQVVKLARDFVSVKINAEREGISEAQKYGIQSFPTILFVNAQGNVVGTIKGYLPAGKFAAEMQETLTIHRNLPVLQKRFRAAPTDAETAVQLTILYAKQGNVSEAKNTFARVQKLDPNGAKGYLPTAAGAVGDAHQSRRAYNDAIPYYRTAARYGTKIADIRKGQFGQVICYLMSDQLEATKAALNTVIADRRLTENDRNDARGMLARMTELQKQGKL
jgi:thioredoxin-related protein